MVDSKGPDGESWGKSWDDFTQMEPLTDDERLELRSHLAQQRGPYDLEQKSDLDDLGVDSSRQSLEADTALNQLRWFEVRQNLSWAVKESSEFINGQLELLEEIGAETPGYDFSPSNVVLRENGRLAASFIAWYGLACQFDGEGRRYSYERRRRGDYPREAAGATVVIHPPDSRSGRGRAATLKKMIVSKAIQALKSATGDLNNATGAAVRTVITRAVEEPRHPIHDLVGKYEFEIEVCPHNSVFEIILAHDGSGFVIDDRDRSFTSSLISDLSSPGGREGLRNETTGGYNFYVQAVDKLIGDGIWEVTEF